MNNGSRIEVCPLYPYEGHTFFHFADFKRLTDRAYRKISKRSSPRSPLGVHIRWIRKKAATVSVTALFHSGTGSETWTRKMLPSADFEDGFKIYNNKVLCKHVGQLPALRLLSLNQPIYKIFKPEHVQGIPLQRLTIQRDRTLLSQNGQEILINKNT